MSVQKRLRERRKAEQAELKRVTRRRAADEKRPAGGQVAERGDLEGYGVVLASPAAATNPESGA
jgi:hypothetical protein